MTGPDSGPDPEAGAALQEAEAWFVAHGLPYFVDEVRAEVHEDLAPARLTAMAIAAVLLGVVVGGAVGLLDTDVSNGLGAGLVAAGVVAGGYALVALHVRPVARWAIVRTFGTLRALFPLVTRALPLLLLFVTFLFINAEVWQVASSFDAGILWVTVMLFTGIAAGFLMVRLPEELDLADDNLNAQTLALACRGTPLEPYCAVVDERELAGQSRLSGLAKANLVLVGLVSQMVQVLLLSLAVFAFFVAFGLVAMRDDVVESWVGEPPTHLLDAPLLTVELLQVSVFLAAFSGLYFTVYAVSDETYRRQFFTALVEQLERAVAVRAVYRALGRTGG